MNLQSSLIYSGTVVTLLGAGVHIYSRLRFRAAASPGIGPKLRPSEWRERREWYTTDHGYRLSQRGGLLMSLGGLIGLIGWLL